MGPLISIVTPCADYHIDLLDRVKATVAAQSVACNHIIVIDRNRVGPAWARNIGLAEVKTPFVAFLDSDDELDPRFAERCLSVFDGKRYIYTDYWQGDKIVEAPKCAWINRTFHCVTALVPTEWAREVGGFDAELIAAEDTDFFLKLTTGYHCGKRLPEPLFRYGSGGKRSKAFINTPAYERTLQLFTERYGGRQMGCCGDNEPTPDVPANDPLPGDVLARAIWNGNRVEIGRVTRRHYPRTGNGKQLYADPRDIAAAPHLLQRVIENPLPNSYPNIPAQARVQYLEPAPPDAFPAKLMYTPLDGAVEVGAAFNDFQRARWPQLPPIAPTPPQTVTPAVVAPDVAKAVALYRGARGEHQ